MPTRSSKKVLSTMDVRTEASWWRSEMKKKAAALMLDALRFWIATLLKSHPESDQSSWTFSLTALFTSHVWPGD